MAVNREVVYHVKENKYSFIKVGSTYRIQSLIEEDKVEKINANALLMSGKEFLKDLKEEEGIGYAIIVKPKEEESPKQAPIPTEIQQLLD